MKRTIILFASLFALLQLACADDDKPIQMEQMPKAAQEFIRTHFSGSTIAIAKQETDFFDKNYDVIFTDGNKVEFNRKGEWTEVDCRYSQVPVAIIPAAVKAYIDSKYPNTPVLDIEKSDRGGYDVKLSNNFDIEFDKRFNVIDIDR